MQSVLIRLLCLVVSNSYLKSESGRIIKVKSGQYKAVATAEFELDKEWTAEDNQRLIGKLLYIYDILQERIAPSTLLAFDTGRQAMAIRMMAGLTTSMDRFMKRWNLIDRGYDGSPAKRQKMSK